MHNLSRQKNFKKHKLVSQRQIRSYVNLITEECPPANLYGASGLDNEGGVRFQRHTLTILLKGGATLDKGSKVFPVLLHVAHNFPPNSGMVGARIVQ